MQNQYQTTTQTQNLQGISNPQNVRDNQTIQQGVLETNQATSALYNTPSSISITVPGAGKIAPITENSITPKTIETNSKITDQLLLSGGIILLIILLFFGIYLFDKIRLKKLEII